MRLGYKASAEQFSPNALLGFAVEAEQAGFDSVFVSDHFQPWKHTNGHAPLESAGDLWSDTPVPRHLPARAGEIPDVRAVRCPRRRLFGRRPMGP